jgi:hypothetical protein
LEGIVPVKEDLLVRIFFSAGRDRQAVIDELRFQRQLHQRTLDEYQRLQSGSLTEFAGDDTEPLAPHLPFWRATLRFGIAYEEHYLHWLDEALQMIAALE